MEQPEPKPISMWRECALWLAAAFLVRVLFYLISPQVIDSADSILYLDAAQKIYETRLDELYPRIPMLYPACSAFAREFVSDIETAAIFVSLVSGTLLLIPILLLSNRLHGRSAARYSAMIVTLWPWLVDYSCRVAPEALYMTLWFAAIYAVLAISRGKAWVWPALAFCLICLYHARPEGIVTAIAVIVAGLIPEQDRKRTAIRLVPIVLLLIVSISANYWFVHRLAVNSGIAPRLSIDSIQYSLFDRGADSARTALRLAFNVIPTMIGIVLGPLALVGIFAKADRNRDYKYDAGVALVAAAQFIAAALSTFAEPRYVMATIVATSLWSARGAAVLAAKAAASVRWRALRFAPAALIVATMSIGMYPNIVPPLLGEMSYKPLEYKIAGKWMRDNLEPGLIMSRKPQVGYYANMATSGPAPDDTLEKIHQRLLESDFKYLVVDERYSTQMIPALKPLLDPANAPSWLRTLKADASPYKAAPIVIYEVVRDSSAP
ncbi:MAG: glycosyltransferase family 39 protein [Candidatus Hydrogenedentes bacterium]|nr:glycosyltransferase family 39 protein [Candidatus Hydrogenedentota bacterium]